MIIVSAYLTDKLIGFTGRWSFRPREGMYYYPEESIEDKDDDPESSFCFLEAATADSAAVNFLFSPTTGVGVVDREFSALE